MANREIRDSRHELWRLQWTSGVAPIACMGRPCRDIRRQRPDARVRWAVGIGEEIFDSRGFLRPHPAPVTRYPNGQGARASLLGSVFIPTPLASSLCSVRTWGGALGRHARCGVDPSGRYGYDGREMSFVTLWYAETGVCGGPGGHETKEAANPDRWWHRYRCSCSRSGGMRRAKDGRAL